ncbi:MAG TPA: cupredoxin domain-containing protein, partial [Anaerolineae bacterium]
MTPDKIIVTLGGLAAIAFIVWFFWLVKKEGIKAALSSGGYQEAMVLVKGGYTPDVIIVEKGKPVRLNFVRT